MDQNDSLWSSKKNRKILIRGFFKLFILTLLMILILFVSANRLDWWEGWAYVIQGLVSVLVSRILLIRYKPETALERAEADRKQDTAEWDKLLMPLTALVLPMLSWVVAGLDERFQWSPDLPDWIQLTALMLLFLGNQAGTWAMLTNPFFSAVVRKQDERGHTVFTQGPYRIVRHPAYAGGVLSWLVSPVFFSSWWLIIPAVLAAAAGVTRTHLEDRFLQQELPGYREYAEKVKYRLFPGVW